jgi:hypothetical protein
MSPPQLQKLGPISAELHTHVNAPHPPALITQPACSYCSSSQVFKARRMSATCFSRSGTSFMG